MYERDAQERAEILARDVASAKAKRKIRISADGSRVVIGSGGIDAVLNVMPDDQAPAGHYMVRIRFVSHGSGEDVEEPIHARGRPGELNVPSDGDIVLWASPRLGE